jgi:hypothetical protein
MAPDADAPPLSEGDANAFLEGVPLSARSIGHTSVVFKVELSTAKKAVWKPASRRGPFRYKGEIAAYRLGVALGLPNVPRAFFRSFSEASARAATQANSEARELFEREAVIKSGAVASAIIPWIPDLGFLAIEREPLASQWRTWLHGGTTIPDDKTALAAQISTLVAFDFLTANWDRWSGGNVGFDKAANTLLFIDNDGAFFEMPPPAALRKNLDLLRGVDRFSRSFIAHVRALDDEKLAEALGEETAGLPLLSAKALSGVSHRRTELLAVIDAKRAASSDASVFAFP